jgi:hypothetical protein
MYRIAACLKFNVATAGAVRALVARNAAAV